MATVNPDGYGTAELLLARGRALLALGRTAEAEESLIAARQTAAVRALSPVAAAADRELRAIAR